MQDAVLNTLKRIAGFEHRTVGALHAYLRQAVINRIYDVVHRVRRRGVPAEMPEQLTDAGPSPLEAAIRRERIERFVDGLQQLRPVDRQVIIGRLGMGYSHDEIASRLGKSAAASRMAVIRALTRLAAATGVS